MSRFVLYGLILWAIFWTVTAQAQENVPREYDIREITVTGRRLSEIGATVTDLDTFALRENLTWSLGDVLSQGTSLYIKQYGRGTMASASFRGTSPSHTQITWNGMKINSPMLGMVDLSLIPSYFIDRASVLYGAASVNASGGGLGGAIALATSPPATDGFGLDYIQGISSFSTFDEFVKFTYGDDKLKLTTRVNYSTSENDFKFTNYDKHPGANGKYPVERNRDSRFRDFHALQEIYFTADSRNSFSAAVWFTDSRRGIPRITVDYNDEQSGNRNYERTLRMVGSWKRGGGKLSMRTDLGYIYSLMDYKAFGVVSGTGNVREMIFSRNAVNTAYGNYGVQWSPSNDLLLTADISVNLNHADNQEKYSKERYDHFRAETSLALGVKYKPAARLGLGAELRQESYGSRVAPPIMAGFADYVLWPEYNLVLKASAARNYRMPSLNDLYFKPGGNPDLGRESGYTYEEGFGFHIVGKRAELKFDATAYDSHVKDWILWEPTPQGYWTPANVKKVHSYGIELKGSTAYTMGEWRMRIDANWAMTPSVNYGTPRNQADESRGKQLVYVPKYSGAVMGKIAWRTWSFTYTYNHYSTRYTVSSNRPSELDNVGAYYMSDISLEKAFQFHFAGLSLKACVYNLFNEEYVSVLSRPMARRNYGLFIGITPRFKPSKTAY